MIVGHGAAARPVRATVADAGGTVTRPLPSISASAVRVPSGGLAEFDQRADVVNLSLGSSEPDDGTNPLSAAVNELTSASGTLFVVAAGNLGPARGSISAPRLGNRGVDRGGGGTAGGDRRLLRPRAAHR